MSRTVIETEVLDRLYLELSQFTKAKTNREIQLKQTVADLLAALNAMDEAFRVDRTTFNGAQANAVLLMDQAIARAEDE